MNWTDSVSEYCHVDSAIIASENHFLIVIHENFDENHNLLIPFIQRLCLMYYVRPRIKKYLSFTSFFLFLLKIKQIVLLFLKYEF